MPVSPTPPEALWWFIAQAYQNAEFEILRQIRDRLSRGQSLDEFEWAAERLAEVQGMTAEAVAALQATNQEAARQVMVALDEAYRMGEGTALRDASRYLPRIPSGVAAPSRQAAVQALGGALLGSVSDQLPHMVRALQDAYAEVVNSSVASVLAGGTDRRRATQQALDAALGKGLKMGPENSRGHRLNLPDYITMATRTGVANASIQGHLDTLGVNGLDLVYIQPGPRRCKQCDHWANRPLWRTTGSSGTASTENLVTGELMTVEVYGTLDDAKSDGWGHPNCRCAVGAFLPGMTDLPTPRPEWDQEGYENQQRQRDIERKIREWKTREALALDPDERAEAARKIKEWQAAQRAHLKEHPYLKRQYSRESIHGTYGPGLLRDNMSRSEPEYTERNPFPFADWSDLPESEYLDEYFDAVSDYVGDGFEMINSSMRDGRTSPWTVQTIDQLRMVTSSTTDKPVTLHRAFSDLDFLGFDTWADDVSTLVGRSFNDPAFVSTSYGPEEFGGIWGAPVEMQILAPAGTKGSLIRNDNENEFLLAPDSTFTILDAVKTDDGIVKIRAALTQED